MANLRKLVLFLFGVHFLQTHAADKYTDENRPYEFGFTIEGEQHRHEKKDENGIIMGEFGFITADGVYHVTVYATDENGNFKILSMKNIRVKAYPTSPGAGVKKGKSSTFTAPQKDSIPESTNEEKKIKQQVASPAKSCSHCRLPTTTTTTSSPVISKVSGKLTNSSSTENFNHKENNNHFSNKNPISLQNSGEKQKDYNSETHQSNPQIVAEKFPQEKNSINKFSNKNPISLQNAGEQEKDYTSKIHQSNPQTVADKFPQEEQSNNKFSNKNPISLQNAEEQQKDYNSKTHQSNPQAVVEKYPQEEQIKKNSDNGNLLTSQNLGYQVPNFEPIIPQSYPETNTNNQSYLQQDIVSNNPVQVVNPVREQYITPQNIPLNLDQRMSVSDIKQNNPGESNVGSIDPQPIQEPISRSLQEPINEDYQSKQALPENKQSNSEVKSFNQNELNNNNNDKSEAQSYPQQLNHGQGSNINEPNQLTISSIPPIISRQAIQPHSKGAKSVSGNPKGERSPKSFGDFIQQSVSPEELASTGPNLYRPSLPNASEFSGKPLLLAAQMQKVDKNTNIYNKNPGESDGLPEGITIDDVTNLLYTFNYSVGFHGHHEKGYSNGAKQGYYYVTGRNGVRTRVDYVADEKGFRPKITQEILDIVSDEVPKPESEKDEKYGLKGYEFKWLYFPLDSKPI